MNKPRTVIELGVVLLAIRIVLECELEGTEYELSLEEAIRQYGAAYQVTVETLQPEVLAAIRAAIDQLQPPPEAMRIANFKNTLRGIQRIASEDLRIGEHPLQTSLYQIEADARAALERDES